MTDTLKVLGQSAPAAGTLTALYTVPAATSVTASSLTVCNTGSSPAKFRASVAIGGAADTIAQYIYYDQVIPPQQTFAATLGVTMAATDAFRVLSDTGNLSFSLFGVEVT